MQCLIVLVLAVVAHNTVQGYYLHDTPEVAFAKKAHFAEHARAHALIGAPLPEAYKSPIYIRHSSAAPVVPSQQFISDAPQVPVAEATHFADHAEVADPAFSTSNPYADYYRAYYNYYYPSLSRTASAARQDVPTLLPNGFLAETPEVAHATLTHLYNLYKESARP